MLTVGSLFAGIGGIDLGFEQSGFKLLWANEIDDNACNTYRTNFNNIMHNCNMRNLDYAQLAKVDVLVAGFPCQAFSIAGYRKGFEDERGNIFFEIIKIIQIMKPKVIFLENVKGLLSHDKGKTLKTIITLLENEGYNVNYKVMNTCDYSYIPHNRERVYIVCTTCNSFEFPKEVTEMKKINHFIKPSVHDKYYYDKYNNYDKLKESITKRNTFYQWRRVYVRENKNNLCPALTANMGAGGHNVPLILDNRDIRKLTPRECFRLQGFPDSYKFPQKMSDTNLYKQIGNSVSVPIIRSIADNIKSSMHKK